MSKKGSIYVIILVLVVFAFGFYMSTTYDSIEIITPEHDAVLSEQDFEVDTGNGILVLGKSSWDEVAKVYPEGKTLGMSTIFRPTRHDCLLTFSEDENILLKIHIDTPELKAPRGGIIGNSPLQVEEYYGKDYTLIRNIGNETDFDMVYGSNRANSITFKIQDNQVNRIIIQRELQ